MTLSHWFIPYVQANIVLAVVVFMVFLLVKGQERWGLFSHRNVLTLSYLFLGVLIGLPLLLSLLPSASFLAPKAEVWAFSTMRTSMETAPPSTGILHYQLPLRAPVFTQHWDAMTRNTLFWVLGSGMRGLIITQRKQQCD